MNQHRPSSSLAVLTLGALGVVYGDIGTSPLYAFKEVFAHGHVPLTPDTRHLIDKKALARMKRSAYLVNTSRGPVVEEEALAWALQERLIAGAALDVYENEPDVHPELIHLENALLVPHLGSATTETRTAMANLAADNVIAVLAGRSALTPVPE